MCKEDINLDEIGVIALLLLVKIDSLDLGTLMRMHKGEKTIKVVNSTSVNDG